VDPGPDIPIYYANANQQRNPSKGIVLLTYPHANEQQQQQQKTRKDYNVYEPDRVLQRYNPQQSFLDRTQPDYRQGLSLNRARTRDPRIFTPHEPPKFQTFSPQVK